MKCILIFGPQGSGKGTQAAMIAAKYNFIEISAGDIIRTQLKNNSDFKNQMQEAVNSGKLISDKLIYEMIYDYLKNSSIDKPLIFDGYPRNMQQVKDFDKLCTQLGLELANVIHLGIPREDVLKRLEGRRICSVCKTIYNIHTKPPKVDGICDIDNKKLISRSDDNSKAILKRLDEYYKITEPIIQCYRNKNIVIDIDATLSVEEVFSEIKEAINDHL